MSQALQLTNSAIMYEDTLLDLVLVVEEQRPPGPSFLHSLGAVVEAAAIHQHVFHDPRHSYVARGPGDQTVDGILGKSFLIKELGKIGCLEEFPAWPVLDDHLRTKGILHAEGQFLADACHDYRACFVDQDEEQRFRNLQDLLDIPEIFACDYLFDDSIPGAIQFESPAVVAAMFKLRFSTDDLEMIDGMNHRAKAFLDLSRNLGLNAYPPLSALPHQFGAIRASNTRARVVYEDLRSRVAGKLAGLDELAPDPQGLGTVQVPPLAAVVLERCKDSPHALASEIGRIRHDLRGLRRFLTTFEQDWQEAKTKVERLEMRQQFDQAWKALVEKVDCPGTRIVYRLWHLLKKPLELLPSIGDSLVQQGERQYAIDRVAGLNDYWHTISHSPLANRSRQLLDGLFGRIAAEPVWEASKAFGEKLDGMAKLKERR